MPTGYTANIPEGISFEQFVWQCARGMGALIMMRDEPGDAPIPERFEPSEYHNKKIAEAEVELSRLEGLTVDEAAKECSISHEKEETRKANRLAKNRQQIEAYKLMLKKATNWQPPTKDHEGFKEFMVDQIQKSVDFDDDEKLYQPSEILKTEAWLTERIAKAKWDIEYHTKNHKEEIERTESRNYWLAELRNSLSA